MHNPPRTDHQASSSLKSSPSPSPHGRRHTALWLVLAVASLLVIIPIAASAAPTGVAPALVTPPWSAWAYTGYSVESSSGSVSSPGGNFSYAYHGAVGESVVLDQTNTSATTYALQGTETIGTVYYVTLCTPSCSSPRGEANITFFSWETDQSYANLTTTSTVDVNGTAVPALGLVNDHTQANGNISRLLQYTYRGDSGLFHSSSGASGFSYGSAQAQAQESVAFSPALGVQPVNVTPGESWQATSAYSASLQESATYHVYSSQSGRIATGSISPSSSTVSGNLTLAGGDLGRFFLHGGVVAHAFAFQYNAPFQFWDGIFLLPQGANLFLGAGHPWEAGGSLGMTGAPGAVDYAPGGGHFGWVSGSATFTPSLASIPAGPGGGGGGGGFGGGFGGFGGGQIGMTSGASPTVAAGISSVTLQTQPDSVADATSLSASLVQAPPFVALAPLPGGHAPVGFVIVVVVVVAAVVLVVVVRRRQKASRAAAPARGAYAGYHHTDLDHDDPEEAGAAASPGSAATDDSFQDLV